MIVEQGPRVPGVEGRNGRFPGPSLLPDLEDIQERHGWLPREELVTLARARNRPLYELQGLISFYPHFRTAGPPARVTVEVCRDLTCWLADGERRVAEARAAYGEDAEIEVHEVSCLGRCDVAPAAAVNGAPCSLDDLSGLVERTRANGGVEPGPRVSGRDWPTDPYAGSSERERVFRAALANASARDAIVDVLKGSDLRGMGGAGFPTGVKWGLVAGVDDPVKYVICNADESEPGTFKDRQILAELPHLVLEGLLLGMLVVGAEQGWVFVRHEYGPETRRLREEVERLRRDGLLGDDVLGSGRRFEIDVFVSPGGYIMGEETALLECMEGHRGEPRNKPPFPGVYGLHGRPTLINSVETLADVPIIVERGAAWWRAQGVGGYEGLKFLAVSGDVERPDVYCVPMGTTLREVVELAGGVSGGRELLAVQPGGASSNFVGPELLDTPLDFKALADAGTMLGSGALVVLAEGRDLLAAATNVLRFFRNESCGKCVPCRTGTRKAHAILSDVLARGGGPAEVDERISELEEAMRLTSICGLGQVALGPVMSVLRMHEGSPRG